MDAADEGRRVAGRAHDLVGREDLADRPKQSARREISRSVKPRGSPACRRPAMYAANPVHEFFDAQGAERLRHRRGFGGTIMRARKEELAQPVPVGLVLGAVADRGVETGDDGVDGRAVGLNLRRFRLPAGSAFASESRRRSTPPWRRGPARRG